jgi:hypothetical protein
MERLFSPCARLRDRLHNIDVYPLLQEVNLDVPTEELLSAERAFTYADLYVMLGNQDTLAWLTPNATVAREGGQAMIAWAHLYGSYRFFFNVDDIDIVASALSPEHMVEICDIVVRLLAVSVVHSVKLFKQISGDVPLIHAPTLVYLMEQCQSLKSLSLKNQKMDEDHCRVLGAYSRSGLEIILDHCELTSAGASSLAEVLGHNQGPTRLDRCYIDNIVLANGLRGNSRLKSLRVLISNDPAGGSREVLAIMGALRENKGLLELNLHYDFTLNDETWGVICDSLKTHPTLEVLDLRSIETFGVGSLSPAELKSKMQALLDMMKMNLSIHTIHFRFHYIQHELLRESVIPYLVTNRLRPRLLAIQKTPPIPYRTKVLGRALLAARNDANSFWMLLSGNVEVAFPSRTTKITAAASLPRPTTATAASTANVATVTASVMPALTATATGTLPVAAVATDTRAATPSVASDAFASTVAAAAAIVATPSAGQKRKPLP